MITGIVQTTDTNQYGFTRYKVSSSWYGADAKGPPRASEGDKVTFEAFDKAGKDGRVWATIKLATFKKLASDPSVNTNSANPSNPNAGAATKGNGATYSAGSRDSYWADKAKTDEAKEPRIAYFAALDRAIAFVDLALRNGAIKAYEAAKATGKLEVLTALVYETTQRIMAEAYTQAVPAPVPSAAKDTVASPSPVKAIKEGVADATAELESDPEETWA